MVLDKLDTNCLIALRTILGLNFAKIGLAYAAVLVTAFKSLKRPLLQRTYSR